MKNFVKFLEKIKIILLCFSKQSREKISYKRREKKKKDKRRERTE